MRPMKKNKNNRKVSFPIRIKLVCMMAGMSVGVFLLYMLSNALFLENFYIKSKQKDIVYAYNEIDDMLKDESSATDSDISNISDLCAKTGMTALITMESGEVLFNYGNKELLQYRLENSVFNKTTPTGKVNVLEKNSKYVLQKYKLTAENREAEYLEMWGVFENGDIFIMRMAIENIQESVNIFDHFLFYSSVCILFLGIFVADFISRKFSKPLMELTNISEKMSMLDFSVHYDGDTKDEISVLGNSINKLSEKLESNILELKQANNELQKDIAKKQEIDEMRKEFISNVSHELKTPIALIQGYAEGLKENVNDDEESREFYCEVIMDEASKMNTMVKKLLTLNQLEFGNNTLQIERFNLIDVINGVINKCNLLIEQKNATLKMADYEPVYVWADEFQIEEVITNYLTNALNHLDYEKIITIKVARKENTVRVSVHNTGDNIPEKDLKNIWIKFYKVDKARTREYGGSGIGLSIVKAIISAHNHDCGVNNTENGVEFWFELDG